MNSFQRKASSFIGVLAGVVLIALTLATAQAQTIILRGDQPETTQVDESNRVSIEYVAPKILSLGNCTDAYETVMRWRKFRRY